MIQERQYETGITKKLLLNCFKRSLLKVK